MAEVQEACNAILKSLKTSPRGLTITDVSKKIHKDRNLTAKYLDILKAEGKVENRQIGPAKVYWLSQRVPLSAFLCFTKNMIIILDLSMNIIQVNDQYLKLTGQSKSDLIGRNIIQDTLPVISTPEALRIITMVEREQVIHDVRFLKGNDEFFYKMEIIPTLFEEGEKGLTIVMEDITEKKRHLKNMEFLARTADELVDIPPDTDIYIYIADRLKELLPDNSRYYVHSYDEVKGQFFVRVIKNEAFRKVFSESVGFDPVGIAFPIKEFFYSAPFCEDAFTFKDMRVMHFKPFYEKEEYSFYDVCAHLVPKERCEETLLKLNIAKLNLTGLVWQKELFGMVGIFLSRDEKLENKQAILSFFRQASIALARRMTELRLLRSEQKFEDIITGIDTPAMVLDHEGTIILHNGRYSDEYGYNLVEITSLDNWMEKAFPDPDYRNNVALLLKRGTEGQTDHQRKPFLLTCGDNSIKPVFIKLVPLSDGMRAIFLEAG